ncbi:MAG: site-specific integrase [Ignavibacteriae bacterium]|nr:site-specific integrase [Ignavibacteriota bacterium]
MFLSKSPKSGKYYLYYFDENGKRRSVSTKTKLKAEAKEFEKGFVEMLENRKIKHVPQNIYYLEDIKSEVLNYTINNLSIQTHKIYERVFANMISILGNIPAKIITVKDIERYKEERIKTVKKMTCNIELKVMKAIFNISVRLGISLVNPIKDVKKFFIPEKEILAFSNEEVKILMEIIPESKFKNIVRYGLYTGCRLNEILTLQWSDVDFADRMVKIRNKPNFQTKTGKIRYVPMSINLFELLNSLQGNKDYNIIDFRTPEKLVFGNPEGKSYSKSYISRNFTKYLKKAHLPNKFHFHCLRHTFITSLIKSNVNINYVKELVGHSNIQTTMSYIHISTNDLRKAINKIDIS